MSNLGVRLCSRVGPSLYAVSRHLGPHRLGEGYMLLLGGRGLSLSGGLGRRCAGISRLTAAPGGKAVNGRGLQAARRGDAGLTYVYGKKIIGLLGFNRDTV